MCARIISNTLGPAVGVLYTGAGPNLVRTSFLPLKWPNLIRPIHLISLKSAFDSPVHVSHKFMLYAQLFHLHMRVHSGVLCRLVGPQLVATHSSTDL